jgi:hypothetical protein
LNELRRRSRRPPLEPDPEGVHLAAVPDPDPEPADAAWREYQRSAVRTALEKLPPPQRQALGLAFFEDLTHEQVATLLNVPLGTAKTRIRAALQKLRPQLAPLVLGVGLVCGLVAVGVRYHAEQLALQRDERALELVTASDSVALRLAPAPGVSEATHGTYRGRPGAPIAVVTLSSFPPALAGQTYQLWARYAGAWISLGTVQPDSQGSARLIAEGSALAAPPDALEVTLEPVAGSPTPTGPVVIRWPAD